MVAAQLVLECPFCSEILEIKPPDKLHTAYSSKKPIAQSFHGDVIEKRHKCKNPDCKKQISIYWYAPLDYFNRL